MSRFANPTRSEWYTLPGECQCPGAPHESDRMLLRTELGAEEATRLAILSKLGPLGNPEALSILLVEWNLLDDDGQPAPATLEMVKRLWQDLFSDELDAWIEQHVRADSLPNGSGGRSANGSSATASRTRGTSRRRSSTTSS